MLGLYEGCPLTFALAERFGAKKPWPISWPRPLQRAAGRKVVRTLVLGAVAVCRHAVP